MFGGQHRGPPTERVGSRLSQQMEVRLQGFAPNGREQGGQIHLSRWGPSPPSVPAPASGGQWTGLGGGRGRCRAEMLMCPRGVYGSGLYSCCL